MVSGSCVCARWIASPRARRGSRPRGADGRAVAGLRELGERPREQVVARGAGGGRAVAVQAARGRAGTPPVDQVVVHERRRVHELDGAPGRERRVASGGAVRKRAAAAGACRQPRAPPRRPWPRARTRFDRRGEALVEAVQVRRRGPGLSRIVARLTRTLPCAARRCRRRRAGSGPRRTRPCAEARRGPPGRGTA